MSTTTAIKKVNSHSVLNNRNLVLIASLLVLMLTAIAAVSVTSPAAKPFDASAYQIYRQGEWVSRPLSRAEVYQIFRRGEVISPANPAKAYQLYRQGEWASVEIPAVDLSAYHQSERALVDPNAGLAIYLQSERTFVDPQAGLAAYFESERTSRPAHFTPYQLSEWFGK